MAVYADVADGECVNVIVADEDFRPVFEEVFPGHEMVGPIDELDPHPGIGWTWDGSHWTPPPVPEPRE